MNKAIISGRLTKDPDVRYAQGSDTMAIARYTVAVDRKRKAKEGEQSADFISCVSFGKAGEFIEKYCKKGTKLIICGHIQTGSYEKDGRRVYTTDLVTDEIEFAESKNGSNSGESAQGGKSPQSDNKNGNMGGFMNIPDGIDEELPFN